MVEALFLLAFLGATLPVMLAVFIPLEFLISRNRPGWGLTFVVMLGALLVVDLNYNWDGVEYPSPWIGFLMKPWVWGPVLFVAFIYAAKRLSHSRELADVDPR